MALIIKHSQFTEMESVILQPFLKKACSVVRDSFKQRLEKVNDADLFQRVKQDYETARFFNVKTERGIVRFICLGFLLGQQFYAQQPFRPIFDKKNKNIDSDMDLLYREINKQLKVAG